MRNEHLRESLFRCRALFSRVWRFQSARLGGVFRSALIFLCGWTAMTSSDQAIAQTQFSRAQIEAHLDAIYGRKQKESGKIMVRRWEGPVSYVIVGEPIKSIRPAIAGMAKEIAPLINRPIGELSSTSPQIFLLVVSPTSPLLDQETMQKIVLNEVSGEPTRAAAEKYLRDLGANTRTFTLFGPDRLLHGFSIKNPDERTEGFLRYSMTKTFLEFFCDCIGSDQIAPSLLGRLHGDPGEQAGKIHALDRALLRALYSPSTPSTFAFEDMRSRLADEIGKALQRDSL